jgi:hypothetical protein
VVREYKWSPDIIGDLFFDREDHLGLFHWYEDLVKQSELIKAEQNKKK